MLRAGAADESELLFEGLTCTMNANRGVALRDPGFGGEGLQTAFCKVHVAKYLGDGLMVYFGWPQAHEDDAERAVRAGLAIVEEVAALNGGMVADHQVKLAVRVGIQTGSVVMGRGGGSEADVFGDVPNVASRVQSTAEPDSVVITAAVHQLVSGLFVVEDYGAHQLKGIEHPVQLYRAIQPAVARAGGKASMATFTFTSLILKESLPSSQENV